jgi:hypothetical protein
MSLTGLHLRSRVRRRVLSALDLAIALLDPPAAPADPSSNGQATTPPPAVQPIDPAIPPANPPAIPPAPTLAPPAPAAPPPAATPTTPPAASAPTAATAPAAPTEAQPDDAPAKAARKPKALAPLPQPPVPAAAPPKAGKRGKAAVDAAPPEPAKPAQPPPAPPAPAAAPPAADANAERQKKHWDRTRKGVLRFVREKGGSATLRDLHDHSEQTYFVAHVSFSRLMEELTGEALLSYDHNTATAALTDAGRALLGD